MIYKQVLRHYQMKVIDLGLQLFELSLLCIESGKHFIQCHKCFFHKRLLLKFIREQHYILWHPRLSVTLERIESCSQVTSDPTIRC